jgi:histidinol phosphatase-like enzyme (inositol monophosphatase family)
MPDPEILGRLALAQRLAREAGGRTLDLFLSRSARVETKLDGTAVTEADRACERFLRDGIRAAFPTDAVLGEEFGLTDGPSGFRWILDPIDGTTSFVHGVPLYGTLVAVEHAGRPVAGVIHMPALNETVFAARGHGAWHSSHGSPPIPARVSTVDRLARSMVVTTSLDYFVPSGALDVWTAIRARAGATRGWSDCYAFLLVATGRAEAAVEPSVKLWDVAAVQPIIEEAGGLFSDWSGRPDATAPMCLASNGRIHAELLELTRAHRPV